MIALFRPGDTVLHRLPAGAKLSGLLVVALTVSLAPLGVVGGLGIVAVATAMLFIAGLGVREAAGAWWSLRWLILLLGGALWVFVDPFTAVQNTSRVVGLILLAGTLTRTTRTGDMLDVIERSLRPFRRVGVNPETVALTISLTIAMVPVLAGFLRQVREAQHARGVRLGPRVALPLLVLAMRHADDVGDALVARGLAR